MKPPKEIICYCGHDCAKCLTFRATIEDDDAMRAKAQDFYRTEFKLELPVESINCLGGRSDEVMEGCYRPRRNANALAR